MRILLVTLLLIAVTPVFGSMIVVTGVTQLSPPPASLLPGVLTSDSTLYGFSEQQGVLLTTPLEAGITSPGNYICCSPLSPGTIPAGTTVNSYLLYDSPVTDEGGYDFRQFDGQITFSPGETIVGIIVGYQNLSATDALLGAPGTTYPPLSDKLGGLETNDEVILSANRQSVYVNFYTEVGGDDMIRILTTTPEPADFLLIGSGLVVLGLFRRRLQRFLASSKH
jgi:hypothetical protein